MADRFFPEEDGSRCASERPLTGTCSRDEGTVPQCPASVADRDRCSRCPETGATPSIGKASEKGGREAVEYRASRPLRFFYGCLLGRLLMRPMVCRPVSYIGGKFLDSRLSRGLISPFIRNHQIDMSPFEPGPYANYNAFFTRKCLPGKRSFSDEAADFCAPCDSALSVYALEEGQTFVVKQSVYTLATLLKDAALAKHYIGGTVMIFRLGVQDYHRYAFPDDGEILWTREIPGLFHTVQPIAVERIPVFHRNTRCITQLRSDHFGDLLQLEVGAMMVGRICNHPKTGRVRRGEEKGYFAFGGSTVMVVLPAGRVAVDEDIRKNSAAGLETKVKQGEVIGHRL